MKTERIASLVFFLLLLAACVWVLSLPVFPSQDGPVHVYYAQKIYGILSGSASARSDYRIAHYLPPYCLIYYILVLFLMVLPPIAAEKALVCLCIVLTGLAVRYFARQLGPSADVVALFFLPFLIHRFLLSGFYQYCLAVGLAFLALALWRKTEGQQRLFRTLFVVLVWLTTLSHPVPVVLVIAGCVLDWLARILTPPPESPQYQQPLKKRLQAETWNGFSLLLAGMSLVYTSRFTAGKHSNRLISTHGVSGYFERLSHLPEMTAVSPLYATYYQYALLAAFVLILAMALRGALKGESHKNLPARLSLAGGFMFFLLYPILPSESFGGFYVAERIVVPVVLVIISAGACLQLSPKSAAGLIFTGTLFSLLALGVLNARLRPVANNLRLPDSLPPTAPGTHELLLNTAVKLGDFSYNPCDWAGLRVISQDRGSLLNNPWLDLPYQVLHEHNHEEMLPLSDIITADELPAAMAGRPELYATFVDPAEKVVVVHCASRQFQQLSLWLQARHPDRWRILTGTWFDLLQPIAKPGSPGQAGSL